MYEMLPVPFQILERITELTNECHHEAEVCGNAGLYRPACVMVGAALIPLAQGKEICGEHCCPALGVARRTSWRNAEPPRLS